MYIGFFTFSSNKNKVYCTALPLLFHSIHDSWCIYTWDKLFWPLLIEVIGVCYRACVIEFIGVFSGLYRRSHWQVFSGLCHRSHWRVLSGLYRGCIHIEVCLNQWPTEGGRGQTPPEIPKALQNRAKINLIVKTVKNCWIEEANTPRCSEKRQ